MKSQESQLFMDIWHDQLLVWVFVSDDFTPSPLGVPPDCFNRCWDTELVLMWFVWRSGRRWSRALPSGLCVLRASGSRGLRWPSRRFTSLESLPWTSLWESRESKRSSMHPKTSGDFINAVIPRKPGHIRECFPALENIYAFSRRFYPKWLTVHSGYTYFISTCVPWELNPQPLCCWRNALPLSHRNTGKVFFEHNFK